MTAALSVSILAMIAFIFLLVYYGWANIAERIAQAWMREARRARRRERAGAEALIASSTKLLEAEYADHL